MFREIEEEVSLNLNEKEAAAANSA